MLLELKNIKKSFGGVKALDGVDFSLAAGSIHGLCGENGAGKSTLMKILSGIYPHGDYEGDILYKDRIQKFHSVKDAQNSGIRIIHQELALAPELTVAENIFIGSEPQKKIKYVIDWHELYSKARKILDKYGLKLDIYEKIRNLGVGQQQMVEIAKALSGKADILILDEPTSALTDNEIKILMSILRSLRELGVSCIYISHKLDELMEITDSVTVIRDGKTVACRETKTINENWIISGMVGRDINDRFPKIENSGSGVEILRVENFSCDYPDAPGKKAVDGASFSVRKGEILGIAGLMGSGRTELATAVFGAYGINRSGSIYIDGVKAHIRNCRDAISMGMALLTEDRKGSGLVTSHSILHNISMARLRRLAKRGVIDKFTEVKRAGGLFSKVRVKAPCLDCAVDTLSGGNQQKVALSKWLNTEPKILILDEPTRGIDVGAKFEIYTLINELIKDGLGVILISSELPEILGLSHNILVMHEGKIAGRLEAKDATEEKIMRLATGITTATEAI